jgi:hypothetical protein
VKKFVSLVLTVFFMFSASSHVFANPLGNPLTDAMRALIRAKFLTKSQNKGIAWQNREYENHEDPGADPSDSDFRLIRVCNMGHLIGGLGEDDNLFKIMVSDYVESREIQKHAMKKVRARKGGFLEVDALDAFLQEMIEDLDNKRKYDSATKQKLHTLALKLGTSEKIAWESLMSVRLSIAVAEEFGKKTVFDAIKAGVFGHKVASMLAIAAVPATVKAFGVAAAKQAAAIAAKKALAAAAEDVIADLTAEAAAASCSAALASAVSYVIPVAGLLLVCWLGYKCYRIYDDYKTAAAGAVDDLFNSQKTQNYARVINQFYDRLSNEKGTIKMSNVFVTAVDNRKFKAPYGTDRAWKIGNASIRNDKGWCGFDRIDDLVNSPLAKDYISDDGRRVDYLLEIFDAARQGGETTNYKLLKQYVDDPSQIPPQYLIPPRVLELRKIARDLLNRNMDVNDIAGITQLPVDEVQALYDERNAV